VPGNLSILRRAIAEAARPPDPALMAVAVAGLACGWDARGCDPIDSSVPGTPETSCPSGWSDGRPTLLGARPLREAWP